MDLLFSSGWAQAVLLFVLGLVGVYLKKFVEELAARHAANTEGFDIRGSSIGAWKHVARLKVLIWIFVVGVVVWILGNQLELWDALRCFFCFGDRLACGCP